MGINTRQEDQAQAASSRSATAFIVLLFTAEVRSETVDVKYRGNVDARLSSVATRHEAVSSSASQLVPTIHGKKEWELGGAYRSAFVPFSLSPYDCCAPASLLSNHDGPF